MAIQQLGEQSVANWSGCHSVAWDASADADTDDRIASNEYTKTGYPLGLMPNIVGQQFVDEGIDLWNYTYVKIGRAILQQPEHLAFQVWDSHMKPWLRSEEYREERTEHITAQTLEKLAEKCGHRGLRDKEAFVRTIKEYNQAVYAHRRENPSAKCGPAIKDGLSTQSSWKELAIAKSNWAIPLDQAPYLAVKAARGITFTFGGLNVDLKTALLINASAGRPTPVIFCVGERLMLFALGLENRSKLRATRFSSRLRQAASCRAVILKFLHSPWPSANSKPFAGLGYLEEIRSFEI